MKLACFLFFSFFLFPFNSFSQNQNISNGNFFEGEPYIAINPVNPQNIVVAWMGFVFGSGTALTIKVKSSFNGGLTWGTSVNMPHLFPTFKSADVSMAFDQTGNLYLSYIDYRESPDSGGVYVCKSINGGISWSAPKKAIDAYDDGSKRPLDRPWLVVNNSGTVLYLTTKPAPWIAAPNRPYFVASYDGGLNWEPWQYLDGIGFLVGNLIAGPMAAPTLAGKETFHAVYPSYLLSQSIFPRFILASSYNKGSSFNYKVVVNGTNSPANDTAKLAYRLIADPADSNHLVFIYPSVPFGDIDILITETYNAGNTWTAPLRINDDAQGNGKMQDMIWADFNMNGDMVITWRDRRNAAGIGYNKPSDFFYTYRPKDSSGFRANKPLTDNIVPYNSILEQSGNDLMSCKLMNDTLYAVWGDTRDGSLDIWFTKVNMKSSVVTSVQLLETDHTLINAFPNPFINELNVSLKNRERIKSLTLQNASGVVVARQSPKTVQTTIHLTGLPAGLYLLKIETRTATYLRKVIKQ